MLAKKSHRIAFVGDSIIRWGMGVSLIPGSKMPMKAKRKSSLALVALTATLCTGTILAGDGTGEKGFVPPPKDPKLPPAPPRSISSAETLLACCCCPPQPISRSEAKKPPQPPILVTKIKDERIPEK